MLSLSHCVQTAEPSRVTVRLLPQHRANLAVISKCTGPLNPTTMGPAHGQFAFFFSPMSCRQLTLESKRAAVL